MMDRWQKTAEGFSQGLASLPRGARRLVWGLLSLGFGCSSLLSCSKSGPCIAPVRGVGDVRLVGHFASSLWCESTPQDSLRGFVAVLDSQTERELERIPLSLLLLDNRGSEQTIVLYPNLRLGNGYYQFIAWLEDTALGTSDYETRYPRHITRRKNSVGSGKIAISAALEVQVDGTAQSLDLIFERPTASHQLVLDSLPATLQEGYSLVQLEGYYPQAYDPLARRVVAVERDPEFATKPKRLPDGRWLIWDAYYFFGGGSISFGQSASVYLAKSNGNILHQLLGLSLTLGDDCKGQTNLSTSSFLSGGRLIRIEQDYTGTIDIYLPIKS